MCWRSASDYDLYARKAATPGRTPSQPARSLVEVLRDLFRPRRPQVAQADVIPFPAGAVGADHKSERDGSKAA